MEHALVILTIVGLLCGAVLYRSFINTKLTKTNETEIKLKDEYTEKQKTLEQVHKELTGIVLEEQKKTEQEALDFWNKKK